MKWVTLDFNDGFQGELKAKRASAKIGSEEGTLDPYDMVFGALGSCLYATFLEIALKKKIGYDSVHIKISGEKREEVPTFLKTTQEARLMTLTTGKTFQQDVLNQAGLVLVDFFAPWCGPCKMVGPILTEVENNHQGYVEIRKVNVEDDQTLARTYEIKSIPTVILFKNGIPVEGTVGIRSIEYFDQIIKKHK